MDSILVVIICHEKYLQFANVNFIENYCLR